MTRFVGIDASTKKTALALLINGKYSEHKLIDCSEYSDTEERIREMCKEILEQLDEYKPDIIYIEDSWNAANVQTTKLLTRVMGCVFAWAIKNDAEWNCILPSRWRKLCGIEQSKKKRSELKQASIDYVYNRYGIKVNDDVGDAIALADGVVNYFNNL